MKISLNKPASGYNLAAINDNFTRLETEFQTKVLYRNNPSGEPNTMETDLDMNGHAIYNLSELSVGGVNISEINSALIWRGTWSSATAYAVSDAVYYNGSSYIAVAANTNSTPPSANWNVLAAQGASGAGTGDVVGPTSSTLNNIALYASGTGKLLKDSSVTLALGGAVESFLESATSATARTSIGAAASGANVDITSLGNNTSTVYTTAGTSTAYTITPNPAIASYAIGQSFMVNFNAASGASPTLQISGIATPPNLVKENADGTYSNIAVNDIPINHRSRVTLISTTQALVERLGATVTAGGVAPVFGARAWCVFNGTTAGTNAPLAGGNVTNVTRNGVGDYTINFSTALQDTNFGLQAIANTYGAGGKNVVSEYGPSARAVGSIRIQVSSAGGVSSASDSDVISVSVFR